MMDEAAVMDITALLLAYTTPPSSTPWMAKGERDREKEVQSAGLDYGIGEQEKQRLAHNQVGGQHLVQENK